MIKALVIVMMVSFVVFWIFNALWEGRWERMYGNKSRATEEPWVTSYNKESLNMKQWEEKVFGDE